MSPAVRKVANALRRIEVLRLIGSPGVQSASGREYCPPPADPGHPCPDDQPSLDGTLTMRRILSYCLRMQVRPALDAETRVLDAAKQCCERWGIAKVTIDDIAADVRRLPGDDLPDVPRRQGRAVRGPAGARAGGVLRRPAASASTAPTSIEDLLVRTVVAATQELRADDHLALMLAVRAGRHARPAHRRGRAADHPLRHGVPRPAGRALPRPRPGARPSSTCSPA